MSEEVKEGLLMVWVSAVRRQRWKTSHMIFIDIRFSVLVFLRET